MPLLGSAALLLTFVVVCLYATFLMLERGSFEAKLANPALKVEIMVQAAL